jgi:ribonuclease P protein component
MRNRIKRRLRAAMRDRLQLASGWEIVINPRKRALEASFSELEKELERMLARCGN